MTNEQSRMLNMSHKKWRVHALFYRWFQALTSVQHSAWLCLQDASCITDFQGTVFLTVSMKWQNVSVSCVAYVQRFLMSLFSLPHFRCHTIWMWATLSMFCRYSLNYQGKMKDIFSVNCLENARKCLINVGNVAQTETVSIFVRWMSARFILHSFIMK